MGPNTLDINLLGYGTMGRQLAALFTCLGLRVTVWSRSRAPDAPARHQREARLMARALRNTTLRAGELHFAPKLETLAPALTLEVLAEDLEVKRFVLGRLPYDPAAHGLLTNTSSLTPAEVHPAAAGLHFFNPVHLLRFAELAAPPGGSTAAMDALVDRLRASGFALITTTPNRGYIGNYILFREIAATLKLVDDHGCRTAEIDEVLRHMGRSVSLFDIIDLIGVDVTLRILRNLREHDPTVHLSPLLGRAVDAGILGRKNQTTLREIIDRRPA